MKKPIFGPERVGQQPANAYSSHQQAIRRFYILFAVELT